MRTYQKGLIGTLGALVFSAAIGLGIYAVEYDLRKALKYPETKLGFSWKEEHKNNPENCLAEANHEDYRNNPASYFLKEYCTIVNWPFLGNYGSSGSRLEKRCRRFVVDRRCIDHFVQEAK